MNPVVEIAGVAHGGHGVARIDGQVCFVAHGLPGDHVRVRVTRETKKVLWADIEELVSPSPDRTEPCCPHFGTCGGCDWLHFAYPAQGEWKQRIVSDCLERIAGLNIEVAWAEEPGLRTGYRTRARFQVNKDRIGFYKAGSHEVVDIASCPLCHDNLNAALRRVRGAIPTGPVEVVANPEGDEVLVWTHHFHKGLRKSFGLYGWRGRRGRTAQFVLDGVPVVNGAFSQSSLLLNRLLLQTVRGFAGAPSSVLDLYCGAGNLSLGFAGASEVLGLDCSASAVKAASALGQGTYRVGDETAFREALRSRRWDLVLLDPPRAGGKAVAQALCETDAKRLVYVSCDPATMARDMKILTGADWLVQQVTALDLFPNTAHVEVVAHLRKF